MANCSATATDGQSGARGIACDLDDKGRERILQVFRHLEHEINILKDIYDEHAGVQDRFVTTGRVTPDLAAQLD